VPSKYHQIPKLEGGTARRILKCKETDGGGTPTYSRNGNRILEDD
jgi:hypothetical protein